VGFAGLEGESGTPTPHGPPATTPDEIVLDESEMAQTTSLAPGALSPVRAVAEPAPEETPAGEIPMEGHGQREATPEPAPPPAPERVPELTDAQIEAIAARVVEKLSDRVVREIAWDVVPEMAEIVIKRRIKELESEAE
jgi:hypothetical protein